MVLTSSSNPISSILSASSKTKIFVEVNWTTGFPVYLSVLLAKSSNLPGVAMTIYGPFKYAPSSFNYGTLSQPP